MNAITRCSSNAYRSITRCIHNVRVCARYVCVDVRTINMNMQAVCVVPATVDWQGIRVAAACTEHQVAQGGRT